MLVAESMARDAVENFGVAYRCIAGDACQEMLERGCFRRSGLPGDSVGMGRLEAGSSQR